RYADIDYKRFNFNANMTSQVTDWGRNPERTIDAAPEYKYKDIYLYANGNRKLHIAYQHTLV
ncbi:hypothetical protein, partial [Bacteroides sp. 519]|uniref:hypothetical protein n=1 Tax=Bacteroides sp. 519 TaxID=2302937 RepID=UPI0013D6C978